MDRRLVLGQRVEVTLLGSPVEGGPARDQIAEVAGIRSPSPGHVVARAGKASLGETCTRSARVASGTAISKAVTSTCLARLIRGAARRWPAAVGPAIRRARAGPRAPARPMASSRRRRRSSRPTLDRARGILPNLGASRLAAFDRAPQRRLGCGEAGSQVQRVWRGRSSLPRSGERRYRRRHRAAPRARRGPRADRPRPDHAAPLPHQVTEAPLQRPRKLGPRSRQCVQLVVSASRSPDASAHGSRTRAHGLPPLRRPGDPRSGFR